MLERKRKKKKKKKTRLWCNVLLVVTFARLRRRKEEEEGAVKCCLRWRWWKVGILTAVRVAAIDMTSPWNPDYSCNFQPPQTRRYNRAT